MLSNKFSVSDLITSLNSSAISPAEAPTTNPSAEHERGALHRLPGMTLITDWPQGSFVENLAAKHDGHLLVTVYSRNEIYEVDPTLSQVNRTLLATLPAGPTGIVELDFNHFYVNVGAIGQRNTWSIYRISVHHGNPVTASFKHVVDIESAQFLNGLCVLSYEHGTLLSVDSMLGKIFKVNVHTKQVEVWFTNDFLKKQSHDPLMPGINGIRRSAVDDFLYFSNTDRALMLRLAIDPFDYRPKGQLETIAKNIVCDDFTIDHMGAIYATTHVQNSLMRLTPVKGGEYLREELGTLADGLAGATSCAFGRTYQDRTSLYITTTGGSLGGSQNAILTPSTGKLLRLNIGVTTGLYEPPKRILIVCSSHQRGIYLSEFVEPYNILRKRFGGKERVEFVIASPAGGSIPIDATSHPKTDIQRREWASAIRLLSKPTHPTIDQQSAADFDAIYLPGGHAPMFDLAENVALKQLLADFDEQMKPIAAVCHGVVGLLNVRRLRDGSALVHGRMVTGFSLEEEMHASGDAQEDLVHKVPFVLETKLKDQGALYMKASGGKEHVLQDGLLLTGQNPGSARHLAHRFAELIEQCATQDYQQVNLTSSLPKTLITCHVSQTSDQSQLLSRLKLAHLEYIQRNQHLIVLSGSTLFTEATNTTQQDASSMIILLVTDDPKQIQNFLEHEPYTASKHVFDQVRIKTFKQLFPSASNQQLLNHYVQQELIKSYKHQSRHERR